MHRPFHGRLHPWQPIQYQSIQTSRSKIDGRYTQERLEVALRSNAGLPKIDWRTTQYKLEADSGSTGGRPTIDWSSIHDFVQVTAAGAALNGTIYVKPARHCCINRITRKRLSVCRGSSISYRLDDDLNSKRYQRPIQDQIDDIRSEQNLRSAVCRHRAIQN